MKLNRPWLAVVISLALILVGCKPSRNISGAWFGTLDTGHLKLRLVFHLKRHGGSYEATVDTIDKGRRDIPVTSVKVKGSEVHFELAPFAAVYDAKLNADGTQMTGLFRQAGLNIPFTVKKTAQPPAIPPPLLPASYTPRAGSSLQGYWQGVLTIGPVKTRLAFKIAEIAQNQFRAELDSIDQGATGIPVASVSYRSPSLHMDVPGVAGAFDGTVTREGEITGTWKQGQNALPLLLQCGPPPATETADYHPGKDTEPQGVWTAAFDAKTTVLHLILKIGKTPSGVFVAKLDSPDQGASDMPASNVQFTPPSALSIEWKGLAASFKGELKDNKLSGIWKQNAASLPLTFEREKSR